MALVQCPECGRQVSDIAAVCPHCGFAVAQYLTRQKRIAGLQQEASKEAYQKTKIELKRRQAEAEREAKILEQKYREAVFKYSSENPGDISEAQKLFAEILDYKDSQSYYDNCDTRIAQLMPILQKHRVARRKKMCIVAAIMVCLCFAGFKFHSIIEARRIAEMNRTTPDVIFDREFFLPTNEIVDIVQDKIEHELPEELHLVFDSDMITIEEEGSNKYFLRFVFSDGPTVHKLDSPITPGCVSMYTYWDRPEAFAYFLQLFVPDLSYSDALEIANSKYNDLYNSEKSGEFEACGIHFHCFKYTGGVYDYSVIKQSIHAKD